MLILRSRRRLDRLSVPSFVVVKSSITPLGVTVTLRGVIEDLTIKRSVFGQFWECEGDGDFTARGHGVHVISA